MQRINVPAYDIDVEAICKFALNLFARLRVMDHVFCIDICKELSIRILYLQRSVITDAISDTLILILTPTYSAFLYTSAQSHSRFWLK